MTGRKRVCEDIELRELLSKHAQSSISPSKVAKLVEKLAEPAANAQWHHRRTAGGAPGMNVVYLFPHHDDPSIKPIQGCLLSKSISCLLHTAPYSTTLSARIIQIPHYCHLQDLPLSVHQDLSATRPARGRGDQGKFSLCVSASQLLALAQLSIIAGSCL